MIPQWVTSYVGIPFCAKGRTREGLDCYGLVRLIYEEQRGIKLPSYSESAPSPEEHEEITACLRQEVVSHWQEIDVKKATLFDGVVFKIGGHPTHFGMVLEPPWFIHALFTVRNTGRVCMERWDRIMWERRVLAVLRWSL